jgi:hypothetical protein
MNNVIREHSTRRYLNHCASSGSNFVTAPITTIVVITSKTSNTAIIAWFAAIMSLTGLSIVGALYLFQWSERHRFVSNEKIIGVNVR